MKSVLLILLCGLSSLTLLGQYSGNAAAGSGSVNLNSEIDSVSYSIGIDLAGMMIQSNIEKINMAAFVDAFVKVLNKDTANIKIKADKTREIITNYISKIQNARNEKNKKDGELFLAQNKKKSGIKVTTSGVQYLILKQGQGAIPNENSNVKVHYIGTLLNGEVFDSSVARGQPAEFMVTSVIKGWQDILKIMPVGSKWKIFVPQELGYGEKSVRGSKIPPYSVLIFEIELLEIVSDNTKPENSSNGK